MDAHDAVAAVKDIVASLIREVRRARGWTQQELAERSSITVQALSAIENGRATPSLDSVIALSRALNVPIAGALEAVSSEPGFGHRATERRAIVALSQLDEVALATAAEILEALARAYPRRSTPGEHPHGQSEADDITGSSQ